MPKSNSGKTAYARMGIWYQRKTGHIHLSVPESSWFVTTVSNDPSSKRYHPNLFQKLARYLAEQGADGPIVEDK